MPREDIAYAYRQSTPGLQRVSNMAVWVVKFPREGYSEEIIAILSIDIVSNQQKLGIIF